MTTTIRGATEDDIPQLLRLMRALAAFEHYLDRFAVTEDVLLEQGFRTQPPDFYALVAEQQGTLVGMLVYYIVPFTATATPTLYMKELYIDDTARGHHIGEFLMRAAARAAVAHGSGAIRWTVANWNTRGQRFYERLGAQANPVWIDYGLSGAALAALATSDAAVHDAT